MLCTSSSVLPIAYLPGILTSDSTKIFYFCRCKYISSQYLSWHEKKNNVSSSLVSSMSATEEVEDKDNNPNIKIRWTNIGPNITEQQKNAISQLPPKMSNRCKALMKRMICFSPETENLQLVLAAWVKAMKPRRADWLAVLKDMKRIHHPLLLEVMEYVLKESSFEANARDYTKLIHLYGKQNLLEHAKNSFQDMKKRGFPCDQVTLTVLVDMYSKAGDLNRAKEAFEEIKLLGLPLDKRAYGSMIMAYIRAGMLDIAESLQKEMEEQEIYAGKEIYKALLRAYSTNGNADGAQRVFDFIQYAGIVPDSRICALLINAYCMRGQSNKARSVLENMRSVKVEPSDKCIALLLGSYEKENNLNAALAFLVELETDGIMVAEEASRVLVGWFKKLGVVGEVEQVLREFASKGTRSNRSIVVEAGWCKWRKATGVLCDRKVPNKVKGKFYRTAIRPAVLYGSECWAMKGQHERKVGVAEMRMLRWMCGHTRLDKIRNDHIRERVGVAPISEKMVENRLRWFGHVQRRPLDAPVRRVDQIIWSPIKRGRGRPRRTLGELIEQDLLVNNIPKGLVTNRAE